VAAGGTDEFAQGGFYVSVPAALAGMKELTTREGPGVSRRSFLKSVGTSAALAAAAQAEVVAKELAPGDAEKTYGPEAVPITLTVNEKPLKLQVEPRVTLLEALRNQASFTGAKEACDRATCGACTVLLDGEPVYACSKLAIEAQGHAVTTIEGNGKVCDEYETPFGIRTFVFDVDKGFSLNGKHVKINGVCDHHDLGCLGSAVNKRALERQLEILKAMGCNAIRTSHNPPAPELLDLCDRMGFIVMDEAFDMWKKKKTDFDYSLDWDTWHRQDLTDMILRDRNHPSVFIWSIGNEIVEQWDKQDSSGTVIARELGALVKSLDSTRPVTSALNDPVPSNPLFRSGALDLIGNNYSIDKYPDFPKNFPGKKFIATETVSALATRGHYDMPSDTIRRWPTRWDIPFNTGNPDNTCSAYDNCSAPWGSTHEETWKVMKKYDFLSGMFIWTGFDYIGEPTPYGWPSRSSYFGIIDLAGFPKDVYYMYQSEWTDKPVLHLFPHWNWKKGDTVDVWAYTNCEEVELFLNGQSLGTKKKVGDALHLMWKVPFTPGTLKAVGRTEGKEILTQEIKTAGAPAKIVLEADRNVISADGKDLSFVTVKVLDEAGTLVPNADNLIHLSVSSEGRIVGVDNGLQTSHESFKAHDRKAFNGLCLSVIQSTEKAGRITLEARSDGLKESSIVIESK